MKIEIDLPPEMEPLQEDLQRFFEVMIVKLFENVHKGKWESIGIDNAVALLHDEMDELKDALQEGVVDSIIGECADVANFALIISSMAISGRDNPFASSVKLGRPMEFVNWALEQETDCCLIWPFKSRTGPNLEYGSLSKGQSEFGRRAHRVICGMAHGKPPTPEHHAAHGCGNSLCMNKRHVRWATADENMQDKVAHGTNFTTVKLTLEDAREMRSLRKNGATFKELSKRYEVSNTTVSLVINGHTHKDGMV